ncbi:hypothetical protein [Aureimonas sp. AU40]|nr:hypothetical protein [Aureimonas sp. AU40]
MIDDIDEGDRILFCCSCGAEIYAAEDYEVRDGDFVCDGCADDDFDEAGF